jgi:hypothetical protein
MTDLSNSVWRCHLGRSPGRPLRAIGANAGRLAKGRQLAIFGCFSSSEKVKSSENEHF